VHPVRTVDGEREQLPGRAIRDLLDRELVGIEAQRCGFGSLERQLREAVQRARWEIDIERERHVRDRDLRRLRVGVRIAPRWRDRRLRVFARDEGEQHVRRANHAAL
jgi:hypothetical protein